MIMEGRLNTESGFQTAFPLFAGSVAGGKARYNTGCP